MSANTETVSYLQCYFGLKKLRLLNEMKTMIQCLWHLHFLKSIFFVDIIFVDIFYRCLAMEKTIWKVIQTFRKVQCMAY